MDVLIWLVIIAIISGAISTCTGLERSAKAECWNKTHREECWK